MTQMKSEYWGKGMVHLSMGERIHVHTRFWTPARNGIMSAMNAIDVLRDKGKSVESAAAAL
jgi:hypothetical protein